MSESDSDDMMRSMMGFSSFGTQRPISKSSSTTFNAAEHAGEWAATGLDSGTRCLLVDCLRNIFLHVIYNIAICQPWRTLLNCKLLLQHLRVTGWPASVVNANDSRSEPEKNTSGATSSTGANAVAIAARPAAKKPKTEASAEAGVAAPRMLIMTLVLVH